MDKKNITIVVHVGRDSYDVYIGRPSIYGNPYSHLNSSLATFKVDTVEEAIQKHREYFYNNPALQELVRKDLKGKRLGCWCKKKGHEPCHGDTYVEFLEMEEVTEDV